MIREFDRDYYLYVQELEKESRNGRIRHKSIFSADQDSEVIISTKLAQCKRPYFELMLAHKYKPHIDEDSKAEHLLTADDMFWPSDLLSLSLAVESKVFKEIRTYFESHFKAKLEKDERCSPSSFLTALAKKFLGKSVRLMQPGSVVGERALEEKERTGRTASVMSLHTSE